MIELGVKNLVKYYGANKIFQNVTFDIKRGERVGLIGRNGTGKTTIMKILMGAENYQGEIFKRKGAVIGYLDQIPVFPDEYTVMHVLLSAFAAVKEIKQEMGKYEVLLAHPEQIPEEKLDQIMKDYGRLQETFEQLGGYETDEKISKITNGIGIPERMQNMKFNQLSGGQKSKVLLGKILLEQPDILLLDEPSNHLDLMSVEWLETYLKDYKGAVLIISHDRYFLDQVAMKIVELEEDGVEIYEGNYSYYMVEKERRFLEAMKYYKAQQRKIKKMEEQIKRYRIWGDMRDSDKMYRRAKELEKRLEKIDRLDRPVLEKTKIKLRSEKPKRSGQEVIKIKEVGKAYPDADLLKDISLTLWYQDSVGILGGNGTGKTTLLKIIMDEIKPNHGTVKIGSNVIIGYLPQEVIFNDEDKSVLELFHEKYNVTMGEVRKELAKVLFTGDDVFKKVKILSGGEKSRLKLCMLLYEKANVLVLDEPTNHLDIDAREVLEETLLDYTGTILFVSHDRYFMNKVATKIAEIDHKLLQLYNGDYDYYKSEKQKRTSETEPIRKSMKREKKHKKRTEEYVRSKEIQSYYEKLKKCEKEIEELETKIDAVNSEMAANATNAERLQELQADNHKLKRQLEASMELWEDLSEKIELLQKQE